MGTRCQNIDSAWEQYSCSFDSTPQAEQFKLHVGDPPFLWIEVENRSKDGRNVQTWLPNMRSRLNAALINAR
jgi:hypothetical protein